MSAVTAELVPNLLGISEWLRRVVLGLEVGGHRPVKEIRIGIDSSIPGTLACQVIALGGPVQLPTDGSSTSLDWWKWSLVLFSLVEPNTDRAERELLPVAQELYLQLRNGQLDTTAARLVQRIKAGTLHFDVVSRGDGRSYRTAEVEVLAGVIPPLHR